MRCLVMSDFHGNILALDAVLSEAGPVDLVMGLGDYSGFGLHPDEVIKTLRNLPNLVLIQGNWLTSARRHLIQDHRSSQGSRRHHPKVDKILQMGLAVLSPAAKAYVKSLPEKIQLNLQDTSILLVHGSVLKPVRGYLAPDLDPAVLRRNARASQAQIVLHGDTHIQGTFQAEEVTFLNPGSVGWPSDGNWRPAYALVTLQSGEFKIEFRRAEYDVELVCCELEEAGLPNAKNLREGKGIWEGL